MGTLGTTWKPWLASEVRLVDSIIAERALTVEDCALFPNRTPDAVFRFASKRRVKLNISHDQPGRPRKPYERVEADVEAEWAAGSRALHVATVRMCVRRGITLPGLSPAHTRAIAINLGIAA